MIKELVSLNLKVAIKEKVKKKKKKITYEWNIDNQIVPK